MEVWYYGSVVMHRSIPAVQSPPAAAEHLQILRCPGAEHFPTPGPTPTFWHACGFLLEHNYTDDFTGKTSILAHLSRMGKKLSIFEITRASVLFSWNFRCNVMFCKSKNFSDSSLHHIIFRIWKILGFHFLWTIA